MAIEHTVPGEMGEERQVVRIAASGSLAEGIAAGAAVILSIIGLADGVPLLMLGISIIALGCAFLFEGAAVAARFSRLIKESAGETVETTEFSSGVTVEFLGGAAGVVLGILSLLGIYPFILAPVAAIVFGGTLVMGSGVTSRLNALAFGSLEQNSTSQMLAREAANSVASLKVLVGFAALTLGILGLLQLAPITLSLVSTIVVGFAGLVSGSALSGRLMQIFRRA